MDIEQVTAQKTYRYEDALRAIGQAFEVLGVQAFELVFDGNKFILQGGSESARKETASIPSRLQPSRHFWEKSQPKPTRFFFSGLEFRESDIIRLERQGREIRSSEGGCPETNGLSHNLRVIGAYIDKREGYLLSVIRRNRLFAVRYRRLFGGEFKELFTQENLYDLWVHLYKQRTDELKRNGTAMTP